MTSSADRSDDLQESLESIEIAYFCDVQGVKYRRTRGVNGVQLNVKECPVCGHSGWKVYLNEESGLGNCNAGAHPVGEKFNKWKFIRAFYPNGRDAVEAVKQLALDMGWRPKAKPTQKVIAPPSDVIFPLSIDLPYEGKWMPPYLMDRGIGMKLAKHFELRWCAAGLFFYTDPFGNAAAQDYGQRVLIPVHGIDGKLENFQGRDATGIARDKYLFPPGLRGTGSLLYNGHRAVGAHTIVLCEGAFDVIAAQAAFWNTPNTSHISVIGTFGISVGMGEERSQLEAMNVLRQNGAQKWVFMWDGAKSAIERALHYGALLKRRGFDMHIALLPLDKDPNEIPESAVVEAYWRAQRITPELEMKLRLKMRL